MGPFTVLESIDNRYLFLYIAIIFLALLYFRRKLIGLNIIFALGVGCIIIWYIYDKNQTTLQLEETQMEAKREAITPHLKETREFDDVVDFVFSIQDLYHYNPKAYEEMIDNIDNFFKVYNIIQIGTRRCDDYYTIADSKRSNAVNALHSMIYELPTSPELNDKHIRAHKRLETLLNKYQNELYDICQRDLLKRGRDVNRRHILTGPKPANRYSEEDFTYQFY